MEGVGVGDDVSPLLQIFLRIHPTAPALDGSLTWDFLSLPEMICLRLLSSSLRRSLERVEYVRCRDGTSGYAVPFPGFPGVLTSASKRRRERERRRRRRREGYHEEIVHDGGGDDDEEEAESDGGLFRHQLASLEAMHRAENRRAAFGSLRGGVLGDAPGLGKTVTTLALVASTAGARPREPVEFWDADGVQEGWDALRTNPARAVDILAALKPIRDRPHRIACEKFREVERYVIPPYGDDRLPTLKSFEQYVRRELRGTVSSSILEIFRKNVCRLKVSLDKRNRRYFCSEEGRRLAFERELIPSFATLVVVPDALLEHWAEQMRRHLDLSVFADEADQVRREPTIDGAHGSRGVVYVDGVGDLADASFPLKHVRFGAALAPMSRLMGHLVVVVPFSRCEGEFRGEVRAGRMAGGSAGRGRTKRSRSGAASSETAVTGSVSGSHSPLLQIRWLRIVVDEGHQLGEHEAGNDVTRFVHHVAAERRWVLSGTPTTGDEDSEEFTSRGLDQMQRLLLFLRHPVYGTVFARDARTAAEKKALAKQAWFSSVKSPFLEKQVLGRRELMRVMDEVMVMHRKEDIDLPTPVFKQGEVAVPIPDEVQAKLVELACSDAKDNVLALKDTLTGFGVDTTLEDGEVLAQLGKAIKRKKNVTEIMLNAYLGTDTYQSLVDEAQGKYIVEALREERRALKERGGPLEGKAARGAALLTTTDWADRGDRRPIKAVVYSSSNNNLLSVAEHLYRRLEDENVAEMYGGVGTMSSELSRFRYGRKEGRECPVCGGWSDASGQGGRSSSERCGRLLLEVVDRAGNRFLVEQERVVRAIGDEDVYDEESGAPGNVSAVRFDGEPLTSFGSMPKKWLPFDTIEVDVRAFHPVLKERWNEDIWRRHGLQRCLQWAQREGYQGQDWYLGPLPDTGENLLAVKLVKWQACSRFHAPSRWYSGPQLQHQPAKVVKEDVFVLCLLSELSHGLDLSFVTHLFLLEPIDDAALLEQVTSRAHRIGAEGPVTVETVNVWKELGDDATRAAGARSAGAMLEERERRTGTGVCEHCYRSFESLEQAEEHERRCDRNPNGSAEVDPFHLSSVYREIRPPPPLKAAADDAP